MPHLVPLLVRGINNLSDARYCAGMGADKLTFVLDPALPGHLSPAAVKELAGWIAGVELIGEFSEASAYVINAIAAECALDAVLLHSFRTAAELAEIRPPAYVELRASDLARLPGATPSAGWEIEASWNQVLPEPVLGWIVELPEAVSAATEAVLHAVAQHRPLWLGPGLHPTRARHLAEALPLAGLVLPSGNEVKPGLRDFDQLEAVFEALEID